MKTTSRTRRRTVVRGARLGQSAAGAVSPGIFDSIRSSATTIERIGNLDVVTTDEGDVFRFCHIAAFIPITYVTTGGKRRLYAGGRDIKGMAAVLLAQRHLNTGDGTVVREVEGLDRRCDVRFTAEVFDTERSEYVSVNKALDLLRRTPGKDHLPCAFLGASRSAISMPLSIITGIYGYPQFSHVSTSSRLDDKSQYKLFGRLIPQDDGTSIPGILYLRKRLNVLHLGVIHGNDAYGIAYVRSLQKAAAVYAPDMTITSAEVPNPATGPDIKSAIRVLASTQFRYFVAVVEVALIYEEMMEEAYRQGIAGEGYTWIFSDTLHPAFITDQEFQIGSPLALATRGISMLSAEGGLPGIPVYDKFVNAWKGLHDEADARYIESKIPNYNGDPDYLSPAVKDLIASSDPGATDAFLYDATIALGLSACTLRKTSSVFNGTKHYHTTLNTNFVGASGNIVFDNKTGSRDPNSAVFQLTNFVQSKVDKETGKVSFAAIRSDVFHGGEWRRVLPYVFSDGSSTPPPDLPELTQNYMHIGTALRVAGLSLSAIVLLLSAVFSFWTYTNRRAKVVKCSQPVFLHIICCGTFLMGSSIIPLSFDDEIASAWGCSIACMASMWLLTIGFAFSFGALFSKTWRINKIFYNPNMTRLQVTTWDAIVPLIIVVVVNILVLSIWSALSPLKWVRSTTNTDSLGRTEVSRGFCTSDSLPYMIILGIINAGALIVALYQVYRARHISNEMGETKYIALAMSGMLLVALVGVPTMVIASEDPQAKFFVLSCIIFFICTLLILFTFLPKVRFHKAIIAGEKSMRKVVSDFSRQSAQVGRELEDSKTSGLVSSQNFPSVGPTGNPEENLDVSKSMPNATKSGLSSSMRSVFFDLGSGDDVNQNDVQKLINQMKTTCESPANRKGYRKQKSW